MSAAGAAAACDTFGKQANMSIAASDESLTGINCKPQLKRTRHSPSDVKPVSCVDGLLNAQECHSERLPPAKFQRTSAWSNLVQVSTTSSFEGAKDVLCFIDSSYSRFHLFDNASSTEVLNCPLDRITLRARQPDTDSAVGVMLHTEPATATSTLYLSRAAPSQAHQSSPPILPLATTSQVPVGTYTGTRGELMSRVLTHFLGNGTTDDSDSGSGFVLTP